MERGIKQWIWDVKNPPLRNFHFARLVVDEYTYVTDADHSLIASSTCVLSEASETPPSDDFADISTLVGFLGVSLGKGPIPYHIYIGASGWLTW